jgi:hypothetical protein
MFYRLSLSMRNLMRQEVCVLLGTNMPTLKTFELFVWDKLKSLTVPMSSMRVPGQATDYQLPRLDPFSIQPFEPSLFTPPPPPIVRAPVPRVTVFPLPVAVYAPPTYPVPPPVRQEMNPLYKVQTYPLQSPLVHKPNAIDRLCYCCFGSAYNQ